MCIRDRTAGVAPGRAGVIGGQPWALAEQLVAQGAVCVAGLVAAATLQLGHHQIDEVGVAFRGDDARQVETVQAGGVDPGDQLLDVYKRQARLVGRAG